MPEARTKSGGGRQGTYRRIARRLREVATKVRSAALRGTDAERELLSVREAIRDVDQELGRCLDRVRAELSEERRHAAQTNGDRPPSLRSAPAVADSEEVLSWLGERQAAASHARFQIIERGGPGDWHARETGAVAQITESSLFASLLLGGELGLQLLRTWPRDKTGGLTRLGPVGIARLLGGRSGEERVRAIAEARERRRVEAYEREAILETRAETLLGEGAARTWLSWERKQKARASAEGLAEAVAELEPLESPNRGAGLIARMRILDELFDTASLLRYQHRAVYRTACEAALESGPALAELLRGWRAEGSWPRFGKGALATARRGLAATAGQASEGSHLPAALAERG